MTILHRARRTDATPHLHLKALSLDLHARVANALHWSLAIPRNKIQVDVEGDWVTLRGVVAKTYERSCAEALAQRVPGVAGVRNEIEVRPEQA
jgi:osmotically-inducible protein OsmY